LGDGDALVASVQLGKAFVLGRSQAILLTVLVRFGEAKLGIGCVLVASAVLEDGPKELDGRVVVLVLEFAHALLVRLLGRGVAEPLASRAGCKQQQCRKGSDEVRDGKTHEPEDMSI